MRKEIDKIEIKDPPIQELTRQRSCIKRSCLSGCGCLAIIFIVSLLFLKFTVGPKTKQLKDLPEEFRKAVPIYDRDSIERITYTPGAERNKKAERVAYIPKIIISPFIVWQKYHGHWSSSTTVLDLWDSAAEFVGKPISDHRESIVVEWRSLPADAQFVSDYYQTELKKKKFKIDIESGNENVRQFTFSKDTIEGSLYIKDDTHSKGTDFVRLTVNY